jgi:hypothetical protein
MLKGKKWVFIASKMQSGIFHRSAIKYYGKSLVVLMSQLL